MQTLCKSAYQDVYRIKDGVLLIINKFKYTLKNNSYRYHVLTNRKNSKTYENGCKDLKIVTEKIIEPDGNHIRVGQVLYHGYPVELVPKKEWEYQIKTTGDMFSGTSEETLKYIEDIIKIIKKG